MTYTRKEHEKFLDEELNAISNNYISLIQKEAITLMDIGEVFVALFLKIDDSGTAILKLRNSRGLPRKGDYFCATLLVDEMSKFVNWGNISWANLRRNYQKEFSEVYCSWLGKSDNPDFSLVGIKGVSLDLGQELKQNCILVLGPQEPPISYYQNLISLIRSEGQDTEVGKMLDFTYQQNRWDPVKLSARESTGDFFRGQLSIDDHIIVQGPPGTGKTYKMAELISTLPKDSSILVTALTNRALMEIAGKDSIKDMLADGKVYKTSLTSDEAKELPKLNGIIGRDIHCMPGVLTLSTFYSASYWAKNTNDLPPFDYVIMDEASQAFYAMICAAKKLGKKVIWIGDQCQMPPIINMNTDRIIERNWGPLASGFKTLCESFPLPSFMLNDTYRLTKRACTFTNAFYNGNLTSVSENQKGIPIDNLHPLGGPSLLKMRLSSGDRSPKIMIEQVMSILWQLLKYDKSLEIAVLSKFRTTVKQLQQAFISKFGENNSVLIDTVERVQGLTCDVCIFCIPNDMTHMSLEKTFFNVATSRARYNTIIICDENTLSTPNANDEVKRFLIELQD